MYIDTYPEMLVGIDGQNFGGYIYIYIYVY